jgi:hypothetical protein
MSRRTFPRLALAGLLAATLAAAAAAQPPAPPVSEPPRSVEPPAVLRIDVTYPLELLPVAVAHQFGATAARSWDGAPAVQAAAAFAAGVPVPPRVNFPPLGPAPAVSTASFTQAVVGGYLPAAQPKTFDLRHVGLYPDVTCLPVTPRPGQVVVAVAQPPCCAAKACGLTGTWYRELPGVVVAVTFKGDELKATAIANDGGNVVTVTMTADYSVTKDGTVHGVITGVDVDMAGVKDLAGMDIADVSLELQGLVDQPFAFRCRPTDGGLMVSSLRFGKSETGSEVGPLLGMYKCAGAAGVPTPKPTKEAKIARVYEHSTEPVVAVPAGMTLPSPRYLQQCPQYFPPDADVPCPRDFGVQLSPPPAPCPTVRTAVAPCLPAGPPVGYNPPCPPTVCPGPLPTACPTSVYQVPVPGGVYQPPTPPVVYGGPIPVTVFMQPPVVPAHSYIVPPPVMPSAMPVPMPAVRSIQGTWSREVGPVQCLFAFKNGQLSMTATMSGEENGKSVSMGVLITADYYPTRDGNGLVGVITGVDVVLEGDAATDPKMLESVKDLAKLQRSLIGQPFSLTYRIQDDVLMIGNVRVAFEKESPLPADEFGYFITGRFKCVGPNGAPKVKAMRPKECYPGTPSPTTSEPVQYKNVEVLPPMAAPTPLPRVGEWGPCGACPILGGVIQVYSTDPNARMRKLIEESEDLRQIEAGWRRFWWLDQPTILLPTEPTIPPSK